MINKPQTACTLRENMARLEKTLWDRYYKEFLQLLLDSKEDENQNNDSHNFDF
jgi:hypothetical protein